MAKRGSKRKKKELKRRAKKAKRSPPRPPSPPSGGGNHRWGPEINIYLTFVINAVAGRMAQADALMRQYRSTVYRVARTLHRLRPVEVGTIYRGLLVESHKMLVGNKVGKHSTVEFVSYSEDRDVACWFGDPKSFMNSMDITGNVKGDGWIVELEPRKEDILFHWTWGLDFPMGDTSVTFSQLASRHPQLAMLGLDMDHTLMAQREVMLKPLDQELDATAHANAGCPSTQALDGRFHSGPDLGALFGFRRNPEGPACYCSKCDPEPHPGQPGCYCYRCTLRRQKKRQSWFFPVDQKDGHPRPGTFMKQSGIGKHWRRKTSKTWRRMRNPEPEHDDNRYAITYTSMGDVFRVLWPHGISPYDKIIAFDLDCCQSFDLYNNLKGMGWDTIVRICKPFWIKDDYLTQLYTMLGSTDLDRSYYAVTGLNNTIDVMLEILPEDI